MPQSIARILTGTTLGRQIEQQITTWLEKPGCYMIFGPTGIGKDTIATNAIRTLLSRNPHLTTQIMSHNAGSFAKYDEVRVPPVIVHDIDVNPDEIAMASKIALMAKTPSDLAFIGNIGSPVVTEAFVALIEAGGSIGGSMHAHNVAEGLSRMQRMISETRRGMTLKNLPLQGAIFVRPTKHKDQHAIQTEILNVADKFDQDRILKALQSRDFAGVSRYTRHMIQTISEADATAMKKTA